MTDETASLILEQLRGLRTDIASVKEDVRAVRSRTDTMEAQLTGLTYLMTTGLGSILHDMTDLKARVTAIESVR